MIILETKRLVVREFEMSDMNDFCKIYSIREVTKFIEENQCSFEDYNSVKSYNRTYYENNRLGLWTLVEKDSNSVVGRCGLLSKNVSGKEEVELAYLLSFDKWGKGYATEVVKAMVKYAFEKIKIYRIIALIDHENLRSISVAKRADMKFERKVKCEDKVVDLYYICKTI